MSQKKAWDKQYRDFSLVSQNDEVQNDVRNFYKFLRKRKHFAVGAKLLDLGSGTGKHGRYFHSLGAEIYGLEHSKTAIQIAETKDKKENIKSTYYEKSIGDIYPFSDKYFDYIIDVMSSHALNSEEREIYLKEIARCIKDNGIMMVKILCRDGDKNAKKLIQLHPGSEKNTYLFPKLRFQEHVISEEEFRQFYGKYFDVLFLEKKESYTPFDGQSYKRKKLIAYLQKKNPIT